MAEIEKQPDPQVKRQMAREKALPLRLQLVSLLGEMYGCLLATLHNTSEMGMLVNVEQQAMRRTQLLTLHDEKLRAILGEALPAEAQPRKDYRGPDPHHRADTPPQPLRGRIPGVEDNYSRREQAERGGGLVAPFGQRAFLQGPAGAC